MTLIGALCDIGLSVQGGTSDGEKLWDEGWAWYMGRDDSLSPYATSNKRGANYGTLSTDSGLEGVSEVK